MACLHEQIQLHVFAAYDWISHRIILPFPKQDFHKSLDFRNRSYPHELHKFD